MAIHSPQTKMSISSLLAALNRLFIFLFLIIFVCVLFINLLVMPGRSIRFPLKLSAPAVLCVRI